MSTVLVITSSALGAASVSKQFVQDAVAERLAFGADVRQQAIDTARKELGHVIGPDEYFRAA